MAFSTITAETTSIATTTKHKPTTPTITHLETSQQEQLQLKQQKQEQQQQQQEKMRQNVCYAKTIWRVVRRWRCCRVASNGYTERVWMCGWCISKPSVLWISLSSRLPVSGISLKLTSQLSWWVGLEGCFGCCKVFNKIKFVVVI